MADRRRASTHDDCRRARHPSERAAVCQQGSIQISLPAATRIDAPIVSPDGRDVAFFGRTADAPDRPRLWLHSLDTGESRQLYQADKVVEAVLVTRQPFHRLLRHGKLNAMDVAAGAVRTICDMRVPTGGGSWSRNDVIVFSSNVLMRVPASGGTPAPLTALDASRKEIGHYLPTFLPDGRRFLYLRVSPTTDESGIYVGTVDVKPEQQDTHRLVATRSVRSTRRRGGATLDA